MPKVKMFDLSGKELKEIEIASEVFGIEPNKQAMYDAVIMQQASIRQGTHKVKGRSEVRGGGRKPWRQKGTGRARQGSIRAPQWVGGGVVFGPTTERNYKVSMNRKVRRLALRSALSSKMNDEALILLDSLKMDEIKTKAFMESMEALNLGAKTLFVVTEDEDFYNAYLPSYAHLKF